MTSTSPARRGPFDDLRLPVIAAPMFISSSRDLVVACARAGIAATFPTLNPREPEALADWLDEIQARCAAVPRADRRYGVNLVVNRTNTMMESHLKVIVDKQPPFVVTSLGAAPEVVGEVQAYGGLVLHDVISRRHAEKAIEAGVDGLILVCGGAGGHGGTLNPFGFIEEVREIFDGLIVVAGGINSGRGVAAARVAGADFAYLGTRFLAAEEAECEYGYREMLVRSRAADVIYTNRVSGVHGNFLRPSLDDNGIDLSGEAPAYAPGALRQGQKSKGAWKRVWSGGHGVGTIHAVEPATTIIDRLEREYRDALAGLAPSRQEAAE